MYQSYYDKHATSGKDCVDLYSKKDTPHEWSLKESSVKFKFWIRCYLKNPLFISFIYHSNSCYVAAAMNVAHYATSNKKDSMKLSLK